MRRRALAHLPHLLGCNSWAMGLRERFDPRD